MFSTLRNHIEEIVQLSDAEFDIVSSYFYARKFKKNQFLIQAGDLVPNDYFIVKGLVKSSYTDEKGDEHILQFAMENWWISDPKAYHNEGLADLDVLCLEPTETLFISLHNREKLCAELRKMEFFFRKKTVSGYIALQKRILLLISLNAKERYEILLKQYPTLIQRVPKTAIAAYLGVSRETLSRISL